MPVTALRQAKQAPEFTHSPPDAAAIVQILRRQRQPNGEPLRSSPHETRFAAAANLGKDRHRSSPDPPSGPCTLARPTGRLRCSGNCTLPADGRMKLHSFMQFMSWLNLWRPGRRQVLSGLRMGCRGDMPRPPCPWHRAPPGPLPAGCPLPGSHRHGAAPAAGQEA